ncbi:hypothetical protein MKZ38_006840 [Zalerion maritima]|uniref:GED domain-containing protein n=1 Tax=Zalerion maritima TaxID=339359 RepID=A0AAD5RJ38_9PEZI|nr:hypothetical protein MKZ38_006840 [Zalerion maritima]
MASPNSIILAIISARSEIVLQQVLSKARRVDPNRQRTLGIITKPDTVAPGTGEEARFIRLAKNREATRALAHGWHVLRNRREGEESLSDAVRDANEAEFFASGDWSAVPTRDRGIDQLRRKLSKILLNNIEQNMPDLMEKIKENLDEREPKLLELGDSRSSPSDRRAFLNSISQKFRSLAYNAMIGHYNDEAFDFVLDVKGARRKIVREGEEDDPDIPDFIRPYVDRYPVDKPAPIRIEDLCKEIETNASKTQGIEFPGSSNDQLALDLFRDQSAGWEKISKHYVNDVICFFREFVETLLFHVSLKTTITYNALKQEFIDPFFDQKETHLRQKLNELIRHYRAGFGLSQKTFAENVIVLAIENCLIRDIAGIFSSSNFQALSDEELEFLAAEPLDVRQTREELQTDVKALKEGLILCQRSCTSRAQTALPPGMANILAPAARPKTPSTQSQKPHASPVSKNSLALTPARTPASPKVPQPLRPNYAFQSICSPNKSAAVPVFSWVVSRLFEPRYVVAKLEHFTEKLHSPLLRSGRVTNASPRKLPPSRTDLGATVTRARGRRPVKKRRFRRSAPRNTRGTCTDHIALTAAAPLVLSPPARFFRLTYSSQARGEASFSSAPDGNLPAFLRGGEQQEDHRHRRLHAFPGGKTG